MFSMLSVIFKMFLKMKYVNVKCYRGMLALVVFYSACSSDSLPGLLPRCCSGCFGCEVVNNYMKFMIMRNWILVLAWNPSLVSSARDIRNPIHTQHASAPLKNVNHINEKPWPRSL